MRGGWEVVGNEVHVKGLTMRHPDVPEALRGTYAGLGHQAVVDYLTGLGVTAVELLPVHQYVPEAFLRDRGLTNYWGYNTIGYFAPHHAYSAAVRAGQDGGQLGQQVAEFKAMVRALHHAGLRSSSTWCSTTPRRAARADPRCASGGWTTLPITGWIRVTRAGTTTRPGPATR
jgi:hypothetical protein